MPLAPSSAVHRSPASASSSARHVSATKLSQLNPSNASATAAVTSTRPRKSPPPASATSLALPLSSSSARSPPRASPPPSSVSDRALLADVAHLEDWITAIKHSQNIAAFAPVIAKLKRAIFTPTQVKQQERERKTKQQLQRAAPLSSRGPKPASAAPPSMAFVTVSSLPSHSPLTSCSLSPSTSPSSSSRSLSSTCLSAVEADADLDSLLEFDDKIAEFASKRAGGLIAAPHHQPNRSIAPEGVKFEHGRWIAINSNISDKIGNNDDAFSDDADGLDDTLVLGSTATTTTSTDLHFPADLDDIPDFEDEAKPAAQHSQPSASPMVAPAAAQSPVSLSPFEEQREDSVIGHARPELNFDELDAISDFDDDENANTQTAQTNSIISTAAMITITSLPDTTTVCAPPAVPVPVPDELDLEELERIDAEPSAEVSATDAALASPAVRATGSLHSRLLRRSLGGADQFAFPKDLDDVLDEPAHRLPAAAATALATAMPASKQLHEFAVSAAMRDVINRSEHTHAATFRALKDSPWRAALGVDPAVDPGLMLAFIAHQAKLFAASKTHAAPSTRSAVKPVSPLTRGVRTRR